MTAILIDGVLADALDGYREAEAAGDEDEQTSCAEWIAAIVQRRTREQKEAAE